MLVTLIIISIILIISIYANINSYNKITVLEKQLDKIESIETNSINLVENLLVTYIKVFTKLKRIDRLGSFESDDEVGFVFKTIKNTIEELKIELDNLKTILKKEGNAANDGE
jgi:hypothetical protein